MIFSDVRPRNRFARPRTPTSLSPEITLLGTQRVNFYALTEGRGVTLIDCGFDGHWRYLLDWLERTQRSVDDIEAVVLTHGHADHVGFAERLASTGVPVHIHHADAAFACTPEMRRPPQRLRKNIWRPSALRLLAEASLDGVFRQAPLTAPSTFDGGATLDVPGRLQAIALPGHSPGSVALVSPHLGVVFTGDALMTRDPMLGHEGPLVFAEHTARTPDAFRAIAALEPLGDCALLPAHGEPWMDAGATRRALQSARMV